jgi:hypothetical protein
MNESKFIQAILRHMSAPEVLDAVTNGADAATGEQNIQTYVAHALASGRPRMNVFGALLDYGYNIDASEQQKLRPQWRPQLLAAIVRECEANPVALAELQGGDLRNSISRVVAEDDVETFVALDKVGLIDREPAYKMMKMRISALTGYFSQAIGKGAARCGQYLLATSAREIMPSFPEEERMWPKEVEMARDIVFQIPDSDMDRCVEILADMETPKSEPRRQIHEKSEAVTVALLERAAELSSGVLSAAGEQLLRGAIARSVEGHGSGMGKKAEQVLIDVIRVMKRLDTKEAFQIAMRVLKADKEGRIDLTPAYLKSLIDAGLPTQSAPGWFKDRVEHLISHASAKHHGVLSEYVADKVQFMREFGPEMAMYHSNETDPRSGGLLGPENHELMRLAELGFPFGPIEVTTAEGTTASLALYERITGYYHSRAADSFVIGHLTGHLGAEHTYDGLGPMHVAVAYRSPESVVALAKAGLPLDETCQPTKGRYDSTGRRAFHEFKGMTPLIMALKIPTVEESAKLVQALVDSGADSTIKAPTGASAAQLAKTPELKALLRAGRTVRSMTAAMDDGQPAPAKRPPKVNPGML